MGGHYFPPCWSRCRSAVSGPLVTSVHTGRLQGRVNWLHPPQRFPVGPSVRQHPPCRVNSRVIRPVVVALWGGHCLVCPLASPDAVELPLALHSRLGLRIKTKASLLASPLGLSTVRALGALPAGPPHGHGGGGSVRRSPAREPRP